MLATKKHGLCALMLVFVMVLTFAACAERAVPDPDADSGASASDGEITGNDNKDAIVYGFANPLPIPTAASTIGVPNTGFAKLSQEKHEINSDTVGWLNLPNSDLDDVVLWYPGDRNSYYLRRGFDKVKNTGPLETQYGSYFADYRSTFDGGTAGLSLNTVIYGHSMEDNPNGGGFSQLKKYLSEDFARENPYIYFSTTEEDLAWEVFAVSYATINLPYNRPHMTDDEFQSIIIDEVIPRSIYNYNVEVTPEDKILTLSTCCYNLTSVYPNDYRYIIVAKLVEPGKMTKETADFEKNPSPKAA